MPANRPPLFRQLAIEAASGTQIGDPLTTHWRGVTIFTVTAFVLVGALLGFMSMVEYSPIHRVPSYADARSGLVRLKAPVSGMVTKIAVEEGAAVREGALLAMLGSDRLRSDGSSQHAALRLKLNEERDMVIREIDAARQEAAAHHALLERRTSGLRSERETLRADVRSGEQLLLSLAAQSDQFSSVAAQGYVSKLQAAQKRDEVTAQESRGAAARAALARVERDIDIAQAERRLVQTRLAGLIENRRRSSAELDRLVVRSDAEAEQAIRAPHDGTVSSAFIANGQSVVADQVLFTIVPTGNPLVVRMLVSPRAAAAVKPGTEVKVVFRAYPQEKFGEFAARVETVSDTPSMPMDVPQGHAIAEPVFIAVASLAAQLRAPNGQFLKLKPGMLAEALVPIERRSMLEWLFEPILRGFNESAGRATATGIPARIVR